MLYQTLRKNLIEARKQSRNVEKSVLSVIIGEADMFSARNNVDPNDEQVEKIIRKVIEGNKETLMFSDNQVLVEENKYLNSLLPQVLSVFQIKEKLNSISEIKTAKSDGQATGMAMKYLKTLDVKVLGTDVSLAVKEMRDGKSNC